MEEAKTSGNVSTGLLRVMERARRNPHERQFALAYLIGVEALRRSFGRIRKDAAVGVDGVTKEAYGENLEENLAGLHARLKAMKYRHQPLRRIQIPKGKGKTRPIGISATEDKIVQGALREILEAIYEQDFRECSHGFRPGRKAHDALRSLNRVVRSGKVNVILESDVQSFFDSVDRPTLKEMLQKRIADKSFMRLVGKCLRVGVLEGEKFSRPEKGTAQGSIVSPILGNIYLHYALDVWFEDEIKPRLTGEATLIRFADDFVICFENRTDAERVNVALGKRMERFKLKLHPQKTGLIEFRRPVCRQGGGKGPSTFDFLGFTIYWCRNQQGAGWHLSGKTRAARQQRAIKSAADYCRRHRHEPVSVQHAGLKRRIQGHFNYFGVNDNTRCLSALQHQVTRTWHKWLNRRSQRSRLNWERYTDLLRDYPLPISRVYVDLWS